MVAQPVPGRGQRGVPQAQPPDRGQQAISEAGQQQAGPPPRSGLESQNPLATQSATAKLSRWILPEQRNPSTIRDLAVPFSVLAMKYPGQPIAVPTAPI
jgi:hypothetical protein